MRLRPALASLLSAAGAALAAGALAASGVAHAAPDLNVIRAVDVKDEGGTIVLTVTGSKPPNFTTFSMADPPRFVIDLSESRFQGVPEDLVVQDGVVNVVKNLSYGSDATSIARVMVAFLVDVDPPDVQAVGDALVVRVTKPAGVGVAAAPADKAAQAQARADAERKAADAEAEQRAQEAQRAREEQARADAERDRLAAEAQAEADKAAQAQARADAEKAAQAQAEAEMAAQAQADAEKAAQAEPARVAAEAQARAAEEAKADAEAARASAQRDAAGRKAVEEQIARAEAEKAALEEEQRRAREAYEAERQAALAKASAPAALDVAPEPTRGEVAAAAEPAEPAPAREPQADAEPVAERALAASAVPPAEQETAPLDRPVDAAPVQETALESDDLAAAPSAQLREVGFRQLPGSSRVFFRTSVTPRFSVQDVGENVIRVELENTRAVRRNDTRFLDTSFFSSAVAMVTPRRQGTSYVVEIKLRERVPYQQRIEGDMLALDFARPAAVAAGLGAEPTLDPAAQPDPLPGEGEPGAPVAAPAH